MEKYVLAEMAQKLKVLGFKERVLTYYENGVPKLHNDITGWDFNTSFMTCVSRPTYSEAFRWFREKYDINGYQFIYQTMNSSYALQSMEENDQTDCYFKTYEEAELACLEKLIEIIESKTE